MDLKLTIVIIWIAWAVSWMAAAGWSKPAKAAPGRGRELPYRFLQAGGFVLLFTSLKPPDVVAALPPPVGPLFAPLWTLPASGVWSAVALTLGGFAFAWWARLYLGTFGRVRSRARTTTISLTAGLMGSSVIPSILDCWLRLWPWRPSPARRRRLPGSR